MFPHGADNTFASSRDLVANILLAKSCGVDAEELTAGLYGFSHAAGLGSLPVLTELQREVAQGFIGAVYAVDAALEGFRRGGGARWVGSSALCRNCQRFEERLRAGVGLSELCREQCRVTPWELDGELEGRAREVPGRTELPDRWTRIVTCIVIFLRKHLKFGNGLDVGC